MEHRPHVLNASRLGITVIPYLILEYMHYHNKPISLLKPQGISYMGITMPLFIHYVKVLNEKGYLKKGDRKNYAVLTSKAKDRMDKYINTKNQTKSWFDNMFWKEYPNKTGKAAAEKAFFKLPFNDNSNLIQDILDGIERRKKWVKSAPKDTFIPQWPMGATYLNGERWKDEYEVFDKTPQQKKADESINFNEYKKEEL